MKRIVFCLMVVLAIMTTGCNQSAKTNSGNNAEPNNSGPGNFNPEEMVDRQMSELKEELDLSADQEKQVREIFIANFENMKKMREKSGGNRDAMREQMQAARKEQNTKIKAVLSDEQWVKYETIEKERRGNRGQGRPERPE